MKSKEIDKAFSFFNGGKGLDHWSYSSTSTPFAKNLISLLYSHKKLEEHLHLDTKLILEI